jgi:hypothetical protein
MNITRQTPRQTIAHCIFYIKNKQSQKSYITRPKIGALSFIIIVFIIVLVIHCLMISAGNW